jgi:DNA end-binding protein Ku
MKMIESPASKPMRDKASKLLFLAVLGSFDSHKSRPFLHSLAWGSVSSVAFGVPMAPRPYWKGNLRLSLVTCPIELHSATSEKDKISFNQVNKRTGNRIRYKKVDAGTGEEVLTDDIVKAFQFEKDNYIQFEPEEIEALALDTSHTLDIVSFVPESEIDDLYYNSPYFVVPGDQEHAAEAFAVIREALSEKGMVGIGRVVFGSREHMIALRPRGKGMVGTTLFYPYEVKKEATLFAEIPDIKIDREMVSMAHQLMKSKQGHFEPQKFEDRYESALRELVAKKQKGVTVKSAVSARASGNVINLMDALKKSVHESASTERRKPRASVSAKKAGRSAARARKAG